MSYRIFDAATANDVNLFGIPASVIFVRVADYRATVEVGAYSWDEDEYARGCPNCGSPECGGYFSCN